MSRWQAALERVRPAWERARQRHWDLEDGPGPALRWAMKHPWLVSATSALVLAAVLGATFGIPPVSPLVLVVLFVAPIPWWLRAERRLYERWCRRDDP